MKLDKKKVIKTSIILGVSLTIVLLSRYVYSKYKKKKEADELGKVDIIDTAEQKQSTTTNKPIQKPITETQKTPTPSTTAPPTTTVRTGIVNKEGVLVYKYNDKLTTVGSLHLKAEVKILGTATDAKTKEQYYKVLLVSGKQGYVLRQFINII